MPQYKRARFGIIYFFTVVTYNRQPILCRTPCTDIFRSILGNVQNKYPFVLDAIVLLPDHLHCIWTLPDGDTNYSMRWGLIKKEFTKQARNMVGEAHPTQSRQRHREAMIWQRRFWEHQIRNDEDWRRHMDYIHYNPVKHGYVNAPKDRKLSSFHRHVKSGLYDENWGGGITLEFNDDVGRE